MSCDFQGSESDGLFRLFDAQEKKDGGRGSRALKLNMSKILKIYQD